MPQSGQGRPAGCSARQAEASLSSSSSGKADGARSAGASKALRISHA